MASEKFHQYVNYILLISIPIIIFVTVIIGINMTLEIFGISIETPDYIEFYERDWRTLLQFQNPYPYCLYPLGFLTFGGLYFFHPLLPKVFFCLILVLTAFLIHKICRDYGASRKTTIYFVFVVTLFNPFYLGITIISGHYDVTVGLVVLLAVYAIDKSEQIKSGLFCALAFLLKFIGLILVFPLVIAKRKINWRVGVTFAAISGGAYLIGYFLWGPSIFSIWVHIFRSPEGGSIFTALSNFFNIDVSILVLLILLAGMIFVSVFLYFQNGDYSSFSLILILGFILVLPVIWIHYVSWFLPLVIYWSIKHNGKYQTTIGLYHVGGLIAGIVYMNYYWSGIGLEWIGSIIFLIITLGFIILIFFNRTKDDSDRKVVDNSNS